jgi:hypothetical protein
MQQEDLFLYKLMESLKFLLRELTNTNPQGLKQNLLFVLA